MSFINIIIILGNAFLQFSRAVVIVRGLADAGFFLPHSAVTGRNDFDSSMRRVFLFANMSAGTTPACLNSSISFLDKENTIFKDTHRKVRLSELQKQLTKCAFAGNLLPQIRTPTFTLHSQYDSWQAWNVLGDGHNRTAMNEFGDRLSALLLQSISSARTDHSSLVPIGLHGAFIDSCSHHCSNCPYSYSNSTSEHWQSTLFSTTSARLFLVWMHATALWEKGGNSSQFGNVSFSAFDNQPYPCKKCCQCAY